MPYYREVLTSAWPDTVSDWGAPPVKYDPQFVASLKQTDFGFYGPNTRGLRRNQVEYTRGIGKNANTGLKAPKFLSEKARESAQSRVPDVEDRIDELVNDHVVESKKAEVPLIYRNVEIKYSKFGVDDFDFGYVDVALRTPPPSVRTCWLTYSSPDSTTRRATLAWRFIFQIPTPTLYSSCCTLRPCCGIWPCSMLPQPVSARYVSSAN